MMLTTWIVPEATNYRGRPAPVQPMVSRPTGHRSRSKSTPGPTLAPVRRGATTQVHARTAGRAPAQNLTDVVVTSGRFDALSRESAPPASTGFESRVRPRAPQGRREISATRRLGHSETYSASRDVRRSAMPESPAPWGASSDG